jgi:hypothetical protein
MLKVYFCLRAATYLTGRWVGVGTGLRAGRMRKWGSIPGRSKGFFLPEAGFLEAVFLY